MRDYIFARAKEPSTWRGVILLLTAIGVPVAPAMADSIVAAGLAIAGLVGAAMPDK